VLHDGLCCQIFHQGRCTWQPQQLALLPPLLLPLLAQNADSPEWSCGIVVDGQLSCQGERAAASQLIHDAAPSSCSAPSLGWSAVIGLSPTPAVSLKDAVKRLLIEPQDVSQDLWMLDASSALLLLVLTSALCMHHSQHAGTYQCMHGYQSVVLRHQCHQWLSIVNHTLTGGSPESSR